MQWLGGSEMVLRWSWGFEFSMVSIQSEPAAASAVCLLNLRSGVPERGCFVSQLMERNVKSYGLS